MVLFGVGNGNDYFPLSPKLGAEGLERKLVKVLGGKRGGATLPTELDTANGVEIRT